MVIGENLFRATLNTRGRKTGKNHSVMLRAVMYNKKIYFSRHRPDSDWFKNAIVNPEVTIQYKNVTYSGTAKQISDEGIKEKISKLKYPGEDRASEKRVVIEVTLHG